MRSRGWFPTVNCLKASPGRPICLRPSADLRRASPISCQAWSKPISPCGVQRPPAMRCLSISAAGPEYRRTDRGFRRENSGDAGAASATRYLAEGARGPGFASGSQAHSDFGVAMRRCRKASLNSHRLWPPRTEKFSHPAIPVATTMLPPISTPEARPVCQSWSRIPIATRSSPPSARPSFTTLARPTI